MSKLTCDLTIRLIAHILPPLSLHQVASQSLAHYKLIYTLWFLRCCTSEYNNFCKRRHWSIIPKVYANLSVCVQWP